MRKAELTGRVSISPERLAPSQERRSSGRYSLQSKEARPKDMGGGMLRFTEKDIRTSNKDAVDTAQEEDAGQAVSRRGVTSRGPKGEEQRRVTVLGIRKAETGPESLPL